MGFLFFAWHPPRRFRFRVRPPPRLSLTSFITALLITPHSSQHYSSHHLSITPRSHITVLLITPLVNHTTLSSGRRSTQSVAGALHRAWRSCCARGRRLTRGALSCGRRSAQGLLEELLRSWSPPGPRLAFVWQTSFPGKGAVHRASWRSSGLVLTPSLTHSFVTHHFVTHHLSHTQLCHTPSFTHHLSHPLSHTQSFTHTTLSHPLFHTQL